MTERPHDPDCIFCKIIAGDIPCLKVWEDDETLAFMDINPGNTGHALAIPKAHYPNLFETPADILAPTIATARRVARAVQAAIAPDGINMVQANGEGAGQSVFHLHLHILPRRNGDGLTMNWGHVPGDMEEIKAAYAKVLAAMESE